MGIVFGSELGVTAIEHGSAGLTVGAGEEHNFLRSGLLS
jgi:hypothetical protein